MGGQLSPAQQAAAIGLAGDGIAIYDADGRLIYMNASGLRLYGLASESDALGRHWSSFYAPELARHVERVGIAALARDGAWRGEIEGRTAAGATLSHEISLTCVRNVGIVAVTHDLTSRVNRRWEQQALLERLNRSQRRRAFAELAAGLAHDLNNLLTVIGGSASFILANSGTPKSAVDDARRIRKATQEAETLVSRLHALEAPRPDTTLVDLAAALRELVEVLRDFIPRGIVFESALPEAPLLMQTDRDSFLQIALNLVLNARDAIRGEGTIHVRLTTHPPSGDHGRVLRGRFDLARKGAWLVVADTGHGIAADDLGRICEPCMSTKGAEGAGLGLAVVASLVQLFDGGLAVTSSPGRGTTVMLFWPAVMPPAQEPPFDPPLNHRPAALPLDQRDLDGIVVLVVDDDPDVARFTTAILEEAGADVAVTELPEEAVDAVRADPDGWSVVITDLNMPAMRGDALARRLHELAPHLPVILCSATPVALEEREQPAAPFKAALAKPIDAASLLAAVREAVARDREAPPCSG